MDKHLSSQFDNELHGISSRVMELGGLVESQIRQAIYALSHFNIDVANALTEAGVEVEKRDVRLPEGPIRQAGEYEITIHLHADVDAVAKVTIIGQEEA